jgi:hypothetical protein
MKTVYKCYNEYERILGVFSSLTLAKKSFRASYAGKLTFFPAFVGEITIHQKYGQLSKIIGKIQACDQHDVEDKIINFF